MRKPIENGLASQEHAARVQHREGVARAVAGREDDVIGGDLARAAPLSRARATTHAAQRAGLDVQVDDARAEADLAAERARSSARIFSTTPTSRKVPMCGLAT